MNFNFPNVIIRSTAALQLKTEHWLIRQLNEQDGYKFTLNGN